MFRKGILIFTDIIVIVVESSAILVSRFKNYVLQVWNKNVNRKWVFKCMDVIDIGNCRIKKYLEGVRVILKYRIYYENVTKPMKYYYKELRKK
ncbi:hypothetical protein ES703_122873 [subsurface metagenome]